MHILDSNEIVIKGARVHNLKNINLSLPREKFIVLTGVSGSGKSSLAFDTLYAEGYRRYVESLSSYARQFLGRIKKPDVDYIKGLPPAVALEQKTYTKNPRSTVGTLTEIYDFVRLLYARIGKIYSPISGREVKRYNVSDVIDYILSLKEGEKLLILVPYTFDSYKEKSIKSLLNNGIVRFFHDNNIYRFEDFDLNKIPDKIDLVIDRITVSNDEDSLARYGDSIQLAFNIGKGYCVIQNFDNPKDRKEFSYYLELDGLIFEEPTEYLFNFNTPYGACKVCEGYGQIIGIDPDLVVPDKNLSVYDGAIACWRGEVMGKWKDDLIRNANKFNFPIHKPFKDLTDEQKKLLWTGNKYFRGLNEFFEFLEREKYKIQYRVLLSRFRGKTVCPECKGSRLRKEALYVKVGGKNIHEIVEMSVEDLLTFFEKIELNDYELKIANRLIHEIKNRLKYLCDVGLSYLTLNRQATTLSGGELQRINLATFLGSPLVGSLYILDEPTVGLHPRDTKMLANVLRNLQNKGNTLVVVEHDEEIIREADQIVEIGPGAGINGGNIVFQGSLNEMLNNHESITGKYLSGFEKIEVPKFRRKFTHYIEIIGARENNLKNINVKIPLNVFTVVTGVSGSGKSTLVENILYNGIAKLLNKSISEKPGDFDGFSGNLDKLKNIEFVDQNPIGKSSRSNPVTYVGAFDEIRNLYASLPLSNMMGYKPYHFSFNVNGGRCDACKGEGIIKVEMQFMADVYLVCESCNGRRYKEDILEVKYYDKSIFDILEMTVDEAMIFFSEKNGKFEKNIVKKLKALADVGLGYMKLGQSSSTLSGGESQRVKLASYLNEDHKESTLFIFDEPTTGLHFHDIKKLLSAFNSLIAKGHTIVVVEHNLEVIKSADWIIDLGPEGGDKGGFLMFQGTPEDMVKNCNSYTSLFLKNKLYNTLN